MRYLLVLLLVACSGPVDAPETRDAGTTHPGSPQPFLGAPGAAGSQCEYTVFETDAGYVLLETCPQPRKPFEDLPDPLEQRGNPAPYR